MAANQKTTDIRSEAEQRAAVRRATWQGGMAKLGGPAEAADANFWQNATPAQRFDAVVLMAMEMWQMEGHDGTVPRLRGSAGGVRKA